MPSGSARFELDTSGQRALSRLRLGAALIALIAGAWLALMPVGWVRLFGLAAVIFGVLWARGAIATLAAAPVGGFLELDDEGLLCVEGSHREQVRWRELDEILVDHDRLELRLCRPGQAPLVIEPRYRGVGLDELARHVDSAWRGSRAAAAASTGPDARTADND